MARIQVAGLTPYAGIGKESGKPFNMLRVKVVATDSDGNIEVGELAFFERNGHPLPRLVVGQSYEPVIGFESVKGNLTPRITDLRAVVAAVKAA
jgi:hypothetical protein